MVYHIIFILRIDIFATIIFHTVTSYNFRHAFGSDSQAHIDKYLVPSPVKKSTIVLSRYTIVWLLQLQLFLLVMPVSEKKPLILLLGI